MTTGSPKPSPRPSRSPSPTDTPTPKDTPSPTPSPTGSPSSSASPSASKSPSPSTRPSPSGSSTPSPERQGVRLGLARAEQVALDRKVPRSQGGGCSEQRGRRLSGERHAEPVHEAAPDPVGHSHADGEPEPDVQLDAQPHREPVEFGQSEPVGESQPLASC